MKTEALFQINETHIGDTATADEARSLAVELTRRGYASEYCPTQGVPTYLRDERTGERIDIPDTVWIDALNTVLAAANQPNYRIYDHTGGGGTEDICAERCMAAAILTNEPTKGLRPLPSGDAEGEAFRAAWLKHFPDTDNDSIIMLDNVAGLRVRGEDEFVCDDPDDPDAVLVVDVDDGKIYVSVEDAAHGKLHLETFETPDELADYLKEKLEDR